MYPIARMVKEFVKFRNAPELDFMDVHVSHHICWPVDIDVWMELNNGRTLTLYDLGRTVFAKRVGLLGALKRKHFGMTMAGASVRWRARVRPFERIEMQSRALGWDDRFMYLEQSMWKRDGRCASHGLFRSAITGPKGIVNPNDVLAEINHREVVPVLPDWVQAWIAADATRPWPPENAIKP